MTRHTRAERKRPAGTRATRLLPEEDQRTRLRPGAPARVSGADWEERIALFAQALLRERAVELMGGLCRESAERATIYLEALARLPSAERQGRLAAEFGTRLEASDRLRQLWKDAGPDLKQEIFRILPPYHRSLFPQYRLAGGQEAPAPLRTFAARLVREATR